MGGRGWYGKNVLEGRPLPYVCGSWCNIGWKGLSLTYKIRNMKNKLLLFAVGILAGFSSFAQGKVIDDRNAQKRDVAAFHAIEVSSGIDLYLSQDEQESLAVSAAKPEYRDKIRTVVENGVLRIYLDEGWMHWNDGRRKLKAYVAFKVLDAIRASGGSDVYIPDEVRAQKLKLELSGGSDLHGKIHADDLVVHQSGGSDVYLSGTAARLAIHASGGADFHGYELESDNCRIEVSGGSDAYVRVNKSLVANASGGSDIHYKGKPGNVESNTGGASVVKSE